jgi:hypothetical protein
MNEQCNRGLLPNPAMRALLIVVSAPSLHLLPGIFKTHEPVGIQALCPEASGEGLDERVVGWFARPREVQRHASAWVVLAC